MEIPSLKLMVAGAIGICLALQGSCSTCSLIFGALVSTFVFFALDFVTTKDATAPLSITLKKYFRYRKTYFYGMYLSWNLDKDVKDIRKTQEKELLEILEYNADTEYYRNNSIHKVRTRDDLVRRLPLIKYAAIEKYIERMMAGEQKVLTSDKPMHFAETSGTTGKPSRLPFLPKLWKVFGQYMAVALYYVDKEVPQWKGLERMMRLYYTPLSSLAITPSGATVGPGTAMKEFFGAENLYTTPAVGYEIANEQTTRYIHLLFGLRNRNIKRIDTTFVSLIYFAFADMEQQWEQLVNDIRRGTLKKDLPGLSDSQRRELESQLSPDPARADELECEFKKGFDKTLAKRIWPKLELLGCISAGPFLHFTETLQQQYAADIKPFNPWFIGSEGFYGLNLWPNRLPAVYLIWPYNIFYEFIPFENVEEEQPKTVFMDQVKAGEEYELVLTTHAGLYRYRLGDIIRVVDFYGQCPIVEFLYRTGQLLNLKGEKTTEAAVLESIRKTLTNMPQLGELVNFACCESPALDTIGIKIPSDQCEAPFYVVLLETESEIQQSKIAELEKELTKKLDEAMVETAGRYGFQRKKGGLDRLKAYLLQPGAFDRLRSYMLDTSNTSINQLKLPKLVKKPELIKFILTQRINKH
ncbi:uncharacterized protein LOC129589979 [Paramacrobiotus metropolitanus]|uniref:uncharacterized protein LOC129589979 n=1 Tax=Paramacrobiotus metropolitanus TaxID=2943436 RepID=UPI002445E347|nr:uncharacterized protein LOC129589979 [Paramacrobiotus metropolitanus]